MSEPKRRTALVTGGATGIGAAITVRLLSDGFNVFVVQRSAAEAADGRRALGHGDYGQRVKVAAHDLAGAAGCADAVSSCVSQFGRLDVLVNNAGVSGLAALTPLSSRDDDRIDRIIDTNLKAPLRLSREALPYLTVGNGVIVNIGSTAGSHAQADASAYVASKAGLAGLTRALACDLAPLGVRVVCVAPGAIATATNSGEEFEANRGAAALAKHVPMGRTGRPAEVADVVAWVISDQASYVTGSTIVVDGALAAY